MRALSFLTAVIVASIGVPINASTPIDTELATLESVSVFVATGSLGYDAIPELDHKSIKVKIERMASEILERHGLSIDENSVATLLVIVEKSHGNLGPEFIALSVRAELVEPVTPDRHIIWEAKAPFKAVTWSWDLVDLARSADATAETMEMVSYVIERFAESAEIARHYCEREGLGNVD